MNTKPAQSHLNNERQTLMTRLLDAVKQCQIRFGGKTELATENDSRVCCLCAAWESVLQHGLRHSNKALSTLKQVTEMTGLSKFGTGLSILDDIKKMETEPAFWQYIKEHVNKEDLQRFSQLKLINTEEGRGRAWLRDSLNEHSMEKYMHMIVEDQVLLSQFYEDWAFLRDQERSCMLPNMAGGLGSILFAINIDNPDLNSIKPATGLDNLVTLSASVPQQKTYPVWEPEPQPVIGVDNREVEKRRDKMSKKKKKIAKIVSFDDDQYSCSPSSSVASPISKSGSFDVETPPPSRSQGKKEEGVFDFEPHQQNFNPSKPNQVKETIETSHQKTHMTMSTSAPHFHLGSAEIELSKNSTRAGTLGLNHNADLPPTRSDRPLQKFPGVNDCGDVKRWQDVLGIDQHTNADVVEETSTKVAVQIECDNVGNSFKTADKDFSLESKAESAQDTTKQTESSSNLIMKAKGDCDRDNTTELSTLPASKESRKENVSVKSVASSVNVGLKDSKPSNVPLEPVVKISMPMTNVSSNEQNHIKESFNPHVSRRQLPSGSSLDNDAQSNTSYGSYSSTGEINYGTMSTDLTLVPVNSEGQVQLGDNGETRSTCDSMDSSEIGMYSEATESAMHALALAQKGLMSSLRTQGDGSNFPEPSKTSHDTMSTSELKQAIIAMMMHKDDVEEQNKRLQLLLEAERERVAVLRQELVESTAQRHRRTEQDSEKIRSATKENELLKHQLRKYVSAVQMLRRQGASDEDFPGLHLDPVQPAIPYRGSDVDYSHEASEYEKKLVQVADMHGELLELNEHLQGTVRARDAAIRRLTAELEDIRGPLPMASTSADTMSIQSADSDYNARSLVNIWIPSAFLRGKKTDTFHVYQVFLRIRDEEWNVYRRYSEFRDLHQTLKKQLPQISGFGFPPKKTIGHKEAQFVEQRRRKLQVYLRKVVNLLNQTQPDMGTVSKQHLAAKLPFFSDQPPPDNKKKKKRETSRSRSENTTGPRRVATSPVPLTHNVYDGL